MSISSISQKLKPGQKAKDFAYVLPHVGAGIVFTFTAAMAIMQLASRFSEKAGEIVGKLGGEQRLHLALGVLALASAVLGATYLALYRTTSKVNKELEQDNNRLSNLESAIDTNLSGDVKVSEVFEKNSDSKIVTKTQ